MTKDDSATDIFSPSLENSSAPARYLVRSLNIAPLFESLTHTKQFVCFSHPISKRPHGRFYIGWETGTRTPINSARNCCPTFRRFPNMERLYHILGGFSISLFTHLYCTGWSGVCDFAALYTPRPITPIAANTRRSATH
jgi:hypothetical protein